MQNNSWRRSRRLLRVVASSNKGINPDKLSHEEMAAEFTNHLIPGVVLTPGIVGTLPELEQAGFHYTK